MGNKCPVPRNLPPPVNNKEENVEPNKIANNSSQSEESKSTNSSSRANYEPHKVYFDRKILNVGEQPIPDQPIVLLTVCKTGMNEHWFIRAFFGVGENQYRDFHYFDIGSILIYQKEANDSIKTQTNYTPKEKITLSTLLNKCHTIVQEKTFGTYSYNCQEFVTEIMHEFTDRKVSFIPLPIIGSSSLGYNVKDLFSSLEKDFFNECKKNSLDVALSCLEDLNVSMERASDNKTSLSDEMESYMCKVLTLEDDTQFIEEYCDYLHANRSRVNEINAKMLKAWRLASFFMLLDNKSHSELMNPNDALKRCYVYEDRGSLKRALGSWAIPKVIFTALEMKDK